MLSSHRHNGRDRARLLTRICSTTLRRRRKRRLTHDQHGGWGMTGRQAGRQASRQTSPSHAVQRAWYICALQIASVMEFSISAVSKLRESLAFFRYT